MNYTSNSHEIPTENPQYTACFRPTPVIPVPSRHLEAQGVLEDALSTGTAAGSARLGVVHGHPVAAQ